MRLKLSPQAIVEYDQALDYTIEHFGKKVANDFVAEMKKIRHLLSDNPYMGALKLTLEDNPRNYRYVLIHPYKMIYYVDKSDETIYVVTFFNTWQQPDKLLEVIR